MQREVILQELILYWVQSLRQSVDSLSIFLVPSHVKGCFPSSQKLPCEGIIQIQANNIQGVQTQLLTEGNCTICVMIVQLDRLYSLGFWGQYTNVRLLELLTVAWIYWSSSMKMHLLIEDEPSKQMKNQPLLFVFLDLHQVVLQLIASCLYCTILSQDSHPGERKKDSE